MTAKPDAFLSYTRFDDEEGEISAFRQRLSRTVRQVSGETFSIFQDIDDEEGIGLGERWKDKLDEMLDQARFFIPILTPSFFRSEPCRQELRTFLDLERKAGRRDLVLPIYWISCPVLEEGHLKAADELAQEIDERQRWDWRDLLFEELTSAACRRELHALSTQIERVRRNVLRGGEIVEPAPARASKPPSRPAPTKKKAGPKLSSKKPKRNSALWTPGEVFRDIDESWCPEMVKIPAGTFSMGTPKGERSLSGNENPQHEVTISRDFALGRYPVTFDEYDHFCERTGRDKKDDQGWGRTSRPVIFVSHQDAEAYCEGLSDATKANYRLSTEAEWEYACRARVSSAYTFGNAISQELANFGGHVEKTTKVGTFRPNGWGLYDMHGNVREWCADAPRTYRRESITDPIGEGAERALRGGSWADSSTSRILRSAGRACHMPFYRGIAIGFRWARV